MTEYGVHADRTKVRVPPATESDAIRRLWAARGHELDKTPSKSRFSRQIRSESAGLRSRSGSNPLGRTTVKGLKAQTPASRRITIEEAAALLEAARAGEKIAVERARDFARAAPCWSWAVWRKGHRATTSVSGQIVSLTYDPPGFVLATASARRSVRMPSTLRNRARELWGQEVVVLTDAVVAADGGVADLQAIDIRPAATAQAADTSFDKTFGVMRGSWDSAAVVSQLGTTRH